MKLAIVIPVFNESKVIKTVINSLPRRLKGIDKISIIAVNDGSTDSSQKEILKTDAVLLNHPINLGTGSATITGFEMAKKLSTDIAVSIDGDGQHDPKDIEKVIEPILEQKADLVIGSRLIKSEGMPKLKKAGNFIFNFITFILCGRWVSDTQSGFKAISRPLLSKLRLDTMGYEICSEIIIEAAQQKAIVKEVPIRVIYTSYSKSKGQSMLNGVNILTKLIFRKVKI